MSRQITPDTHPDRFTEHEAALFRAGKCCWQIAYGLPWSQWCGKPSELGAHFGHCPEHREQYENEVYLAEMAARRETEGQGR